MTLESLEASAVALRAASSSLERAGRGLYASRQSVIAGACWPSNLALRFDDEARRVDVRAARAREESEGWAAAVARAAETYRKEEAARARAMDGLQNIVFQAGAIPGLLDVLGLGGLSVAGARVVPGTTLATLLRSLQAGRLAGSAGEPAGVNRASIAAGTGDPSCFLYAVSSLRRAQGQEPLEDGSFVPPSSILVERVPRADGSIAVMVTVPGTQTWALDPEDGNVFDSEGILDGMAYRDSQVRGLIDEALRDQNLGADDVVLFNSYSQGGIHVLGLLEDQEFLERYRVAAVTTVGSPVSAFAIPEGIPVLSLTNADDIVPTASGQVVEPSESVVNVRSPSRAGPAALLFPQEVVAKAHDLGNYAHDAERLDESADPAVLGHRAAVGAALGVGVAAGAAAGAPQTGSPQRERFAYTATDPKTKS
ncbi:hypothetical protein [Sinomonas terrae]|uniref:Uncharacterized protein n=1 Tax=Sinomonas terrae TaxID=2908838 RepID=A0ABS9TWH7_9MICC|nr:hypothetical protein [Sinomonas terrae]MCH6468720.1 hypothetical protein [Sinomonas terrae]